MDAYPTIVTPLLHEEWRLALSDIPASFQQEYGDIPDQIEFGFWLGLPPPLALDFHPPNRLNIGDEEAVRSWIGKELELGRAFGPYTDDEIHAVGPWRSAPLSVIHTPAQGTKPAKSRIVEDLGHPRFQYSRPTSAQSLLAVEFPSVNSLTPDGVFFCRWFTIFTQIELYRSLPASADVMGADIQDAFCNLSPHPSQRPHLCVSLGPDTHYVRAASPFGHKGICAIFGRTVDATCDIVSHRLPGVRPYSYVDDIICVRTLGPSSGVSEDTVRAEFTRLGWPLHDAARKGFSFSRRFTMTGIEWDLDAKTKSLPEDKRLQYLLRCSELATANGRKVHRTEMDKLLGCLLRVCLFALDQRCRLRQLLRFRRQLYAPYIALHNTTDVQAELDQWITFLKSPRITRSFSRPSRLTTTLYASDACDAGIGIICGPYAHFWPLPSGWKQLDGFDMGVAEAWGMETLVSAAVDLGERECVLLVLGDNKGVLYGWQKCRSASAEVNEIFIRMSTVATSPEPWPLSAGVLLDQ
ncbi:unnamed protein product [Tilletia controversa]|nr:unnamed protein product [Tilletia controversa]